MALVRNTSWPEHGNTQLHIDFYYNHVHSSTLFLKDDGRFDEAWVGNYPKRYYYPRIAWLTLSKGQKSTHKIAPQNRGLDSSV